MGNWFLISVGLQKGPKRFQAVRETRDDRVLCPQQHDSNCQVPVNDHWTWLAQIHGRSAVELRPQRICKGTCAVLKSIELNKGDLSKISLNLCQSVFSFVLVSVMYSRLYQAVYRPLTKETVLLAQGVD